MDSYNIKKYLNDYSQKIQPLLRTYLINKIKEAKKIGDIPVKLLESFSQMVVRGKNVRGALVVLGYQLAGGKDMASIYDASTFIEILHSGALIHDDVMDKDDIRRGLPTIHKQFENYGKGNGKSFAICAGDIAFYLAWDKLLNSNFSNDKLIKAGKIFVKYALNVVYGQALDLINNVGNNFNQQAILNVFRFKTAEYTGVLPLLIGAILGGIEDEKKLGILMEFGLDLGWAFQIRDDILGLYGNEEKIGKPVGSDLREGKKTLFIYYILKNGNDMQKKFVLSVLGNKNISGNEISKVQKLFKEIGAYNYVMQLGWDYVKKGKETIPLITANKKLQILLASLIKYIMERTR